MFSHKTVEKHTENRSDDIIPSEQLAQRRDKFMHSFHGVCDV